MSFVRVYQPANAVELALVRAILENMDFPFFIENEHYFTTSGGFLSHGDTEIWVMVPEEAAEEVREILEAEV